MQNIASVAKENGYAIALRDVFSRLCDGNSIELSSPLMKWEFEGNHLSFLFLAPSRPYLTKFVYDLLSRWIVPGKKVAIPLFFSSDFIYDEKSSLCLEAKIRLEHEDDVSIAQMTLPMLEAELTLGASSFFHASRILEAKGLTLDEKADLVQEKMAQWIERNPDFFEVDLLQHMQEFFLLSRDLFKGVRSPRHLGQMIVTFYTFFKKLKEEREKEPGMRHLHIKCAPHMLQSPLGQRPILGVYVGMNLLRPNEVFEEKHLLKALRNCLGGTKEVLGSAYLSKSREHETHIVYLEIETGRRFTQKEMALLKNRLPSEIQSHIQNLVSPVFMPRNEEEVMRNILTLSDQLKFVRDLPQVILSFDHQSDAHLHFTVVMLRILLSETEPATALFKSDQFSLDRVKRVGLLRGKYPKEASVLKVRLEKEPFLREDQSLDLYKARHSVIEQLQAIVGEVRDFNGGMIAKQKENFEALKKDLGPLAETHRFLLENFFHSLFPVEVRSLLAPASIKTLFHLFLTMTQEKGALKNRALWHEEEEALFVILALEDGKVKERVMASVKKLNLRFPSLVVLHLHLFETTLMGYIYFSDEKSERRSFRSLLDF